VDVDNIPGNDLQNTIEPANRRWVFAFALLVMIVTSLPYVLGYTAQGDSWQFTGFVFGVEDGNSYIAKMLTGEAGAWLFRTPYTTVPQNGAVAFLPYLLLGKLTAPPGLHNQLVALFQLFRFAAGILAIVATYDFVSIFLKDERLKRFALILITIGGGLGWILVLIGRENWLGSLPLEFYSPETFGFLALFGLPHLALARATLLWGLRAYLETAAEPGVVRLRPILKIGGLWLLTALAQPLTAVIMGLVIGLHIIGLAVWQLWQRTSHRITVWNMWRRTAQVAIFSGCIPAPFLVYNFIAFRFDPFLSAWTEQNRIFSPHPLHYLLAYGLLIPFAFVGARQLIRQNSWSGWLLIIWVLAFPILAYIPFNLQRRLPEGTWVALVILAFVSFTPAQKPGFSIKVKRAWMPLLLLFPSTLMLFAGGLLAGVHPAVPVFRPEEEIAVFRYIENHASVGDVVLASYESGNALPAWASVRVIIGHGPESVRLTELQPMIKDFFQKNTTDSQRLKFLQNFNVRYVFWGPDERRLGAWDPHQMGDLMVVFSKGDYSLFEVK
jgi:hypothetical protein